LKESKSGMRVKYVIDNTEVCQPIAELSSLLRERGAVILNERLSDYHFKEVLIEMEYEGSADAFDDLAINEITRVNPGKYTCDCHWSTVIVNFKKESKTLVK